MKSDDGSFFDEPTGDVPSVSSTDPRVTFTGVERAADAADEFEVDVEPSLLPHWTEAPTGQVPIVVARDAANQDDPWSAIPAPAWREGEADWVAHEDQFDASFLAGDVREDDTRPWEFAVAPEAEVEIDETPGDPPPARWTRRASEFVAQCVARHVHRRVARVARVGSLPRWCHPCLGTRAARPRPGER